MKKIKLNTKSTFTQKCGNIISAKATVKLLYLTPKEDSLIHSSVYMNVTVRYGVNFNTPVIAVHTFLFYFNFSYYLCFNLSGFKMDNTVSALLSQ